MFTYIEKHKNQFLNSKNSTKLLLHSMSIPPYPIMVLTKSRQVLRGKNNPSRGFKLTRVCVGKTLNSLQPAVPQCQKKHCQCNVEEISNRILDRLIVDTQDTMIKLITVWLM